MSNTNSIGVVALDLSLNQQAFNRQVAGIAGSVKGAFGSAFAGLGKVALAAFSIHGMSQFVKESISLASDLTEVQNVVDVTFGGASATIDAWAKTSINSFGMSELSAKKYASTMGALLSSSGIQGDLPKMSMDIVGLTADMASFYNLSHDEAFGKIRSGLMGMVVPMRSIGIDISSASMKAFALEQGITKSTASMSQAEKVGLRYQMILKGLQNSSGDFLRTQGSWANQMRIMQEQWKVFMTNMGQGFVNMFIHVVKWINVALIKLQEFGEVFSRVTEMIFGKAMLSDVSDSMGSLGESTDDVGKATKKTGKAIKGALAGFDQLNILSQNTAGNMDDIAAGASDMGGMGSMGELGDADLGVNIDTSSIEKFKSILDGLKNGFIEVKDFLKTTFGPAIKSVFDGLVPVLIGWRDMFVGMFNDISTLLAPLKDWFMNSLVPAIAAVIPIIGGIFTGLLDTVRIVFQGIWDAVFPIIEWFVVSGLPMLTEFSVGVWQIFGAMFDYVKTIFDTLWEGAIQPGLMLVSDVIVDVLDIIKGFWDKWGKGIVDGIVEALANMKAIFVSWYDNFIGPFFKNMLEGISWLWEKHLKGLVQEVANFIGKLVQGALDIYNKFIAPIVSFLAEKLGPVFSNVFSYIGDVVLTLVAVISDVATGIFKALGGVIDFVVGVFTGDWEKAWQGVSDVFGGIWDGILGIVKGVVNLIIDAINYMIRGLNRVKINVPDWVANMLGMPSGQSIGFDINTIPKLASGGIVSQPTLAMIGEGNKKEAVVPLENSAFVAGFANTIAQAVASALAGSSGGGGGGGGDSPETIVLKIGETEFGRIAVRSIKKLQRQTGVAMLTV